MKDHSAYQSEFDKPSTYEVIVSGNIITDCCDCIEGLSAKRDFLEDGRPVTILCGKFTDQAVLAGLLNLIYESHLTIISVRKL